MFSHLQGNGCPHCGKIKALRYNKNKACGWTYHSWEELAKTSKYFDSFKLYIIKCWDDNGEKFYKVGRTFRKITDRFGRKKSMPYKYKLYKLVESECPRDICELEHEIRKNNRLNRYKPLKNFGGYTECFSKINFNERDIEQKWKKIQS